MLSRMLFRIDGRFVRRVGLMLTTLAVSLAVNASVQAQDSSSNETLIPQGLIAYVSGSGGERDIYVMKADGTQVDRLTHEGADDPAWSPDGRKIAFMSARDGNKEIYVMDADGRHVKRLTNNAAEDGYPSWSPDGTRIAFMSGRGDISLVSGSAASESHNDYDIYIMNADGSNVTLLTHDTLDNGYPEWSPDGRSIAFGTRQSEQWDIYTMAADGSEVTRLTVNGGEDPMWLPDGQSLIYSRKVADGTWDLYTVEANGRAAIRLTRDGAHLGLPTWSPDGQLIAYIVCEEGKSDIYLMRPDGTDKHRLTFQQEINSSPAWQPLAQTTP